MSATRYKGLVVYKADENHVMTPLFCTNTAPRTIETWFTYHTTPHDMFMERVSPDKKIFCERCRKPVDFDSDVYRYKVYTCLQYGFGDV